ncbi:MAG: nitrate- and nitrite sensing domain-containing protein, partial [Actinomycetes bacterium]
MLRDAGVRSKLFAVLAIPTILLMVATAWLVGGQVQSATRAGQVEALTDVAIQVNNVVHSLQQERSATLSYLQSPIAGNRKAMTGQRQYTDTQLRILKDKVAASPLDQMSESIRSAAQRSTAAHGELVGARRSIDARRFYSTETDVFYGKVIATDLQLPGALATSATPQLAQRLQAYAALSSTIEYASHERDLVEIAYLEGNLNESEFAQASALVAQQRQSLQDFQRAAPPQLFRVLDNRLAKSDVYTVDQSRRHLTDLLKGRDPDVGGSVEWVGAANSRISPMVAVEHILVADIADTAASTKSAERRQAAIFGTAALFGLALAVLLALALAQRITRPLRRLTVAAGEIGEELPHMVERMQTPGEGPGVVVEPIVIESRDEIGRLAEAFNTVNEVTVRVAREQAALRASIAEMFVNVARRNQLLLGRQLAQLDQMEAREEDPDVLQNLFRLDHLATRMRRNAESLLVLAGIDSTRRLRRALPLSDVIRTAVGEIEAYERIDLSMTEDPQVSGRHALTIAHLLAELLENATHFSNPGTRVVVAAAVTGHGVDITVTDYGLGMSGQEIAEANQNIAHPPVAEIAVSQRLGLFVVGRLAARLGATAELRRGRSAGIVVTVGLPATVFEGMYVEPPVEVADPTEVADTTDMVSVDFIADAPVDGPVDVTDSGAAADADADFVTTEPPTARSSRRRSRTTRRSAGAALDASVTDVPEPAPAPVESSLEDTVLIEAVPLADEDVPASASVETGDEPVAVEPVGEETVGEETVTDETLTDETLAHETLAHETLADEPVAEQTPIDEPVAEELAPGRRRGLFARRRAEAQDDASTTAPAIESALDGELEHSDLSASAVSDAAADLFARDASPDPMDAPEPTAEDETVDVVDEAAAADLEPRPRRRGLFGRRDRVATPLTATDTELVADSEATDAQSAARVTDEPVRELVAELIAVPTVEAPESTGLGETVDHAEAGDETATEAPAAP